MHFRVARRADVVAGTELIEERFLYRDDELSDLRRLWNVLLESGTAYASVVEDDATPTPLAYGISAFVDDTTAATLQTYAHPGVSRYLFERWRAGDSSFLSESAIAAANAHAGLNVVVLGTGWTHLDAATRQHASMKLIEGFLDLHLGMKLRSFTHELFGEPPFSPSAIGLELSASRTVSGREARLLMLRYDVANVDHFVVAQLTRGIAAPRLRLNNRARSVLRLAIGGLIDADIAHEVGVSPNGLKKRWQHMFDHIRENDPGFFAGAGATSGEDGKRGAELRNTVITYVRSHRAELHPYAPSVAVRAVPDDVGS